MPVKVTCNPADASEINEAAELLDLKVEWDWRIRPGLVRLSVYTEDPDVIPITRKFSRGYERWRRQF